ncbi:capsular biosynthesis protein [Xenorhabdus hominickii]|uniref:Capsular biosynthesis protein n=1 Tax=Xenorhabdus hominickii TaxID=351679 RepID=A0A2G0QEN5_XENHO|nr:capsular biosynthesis protein [Xenorhabdus hominickii]AOM41725.1 capsular biosynthesis protein [Xenorhabdus hominickii]PHM57682.1 capsular biosynthesis protein [Xenorhabdus hominickii]
MFLIMSADYVGQELESEFGKIPPCFLPLGNKRLYEYQVKLIPHNIKKVISVPESFVLPVSDEKWLKNNEVEIVRITDGLSLGASLISAMNLIDDGFESPIHILFGDTLITSLPQGEDIFGVSETVDSYNWAKISDFSNNINLTNDLDNLVINGYFNFSTPKDLLKSIIKNKWDFINGLIEYNEKIGLEAKKITAWLDFGHVNTYYRSKAKFTTQRSFNELRITNDWIEKTSSQKNDKILAEAKWFENIPSEIRQYTPLYLGSTINENIVTYKLEYLYYSALNELLVFSNMPITTWKKIIKKCIEFLKKCQKYPPITGETKNTLDELLIKKTKKRLLQYCKEIGISTDKKWVFNKDKKRSISDILLTSERNLPSPFPLSILHGDFCFSNILYDFKTERIKTIDPRGITNNKDFSIYGDIAYDIAKLSHSILGLYDFIIAEKYSLSINENDIEFNILVEDNIEKIQTVFTDNICKEFNISISNLFAMQIQLFISMLPLHKDDIKRQQALFANAFRINNILEELEK